MGGNTDVEAAKSQSVAGRHMQLRYTERQPWFDVRLWRKRTWAAVIIVLAIVAGLFAAAGIVIPKELAKHAYASYERKEFQLAMEYSGKTFFDRFQFWEGDDMTDGHVQWTTRERANELNITSITSDSAILRVDTSLTNALNGRPSARIYTYPPKPLDSALVIVDVLHAPYACGIWPALRLTTSPGTPTHPLEIAPRRGMELDLLDARQMIPSDSTNNSTEMAEMLMYEASRSNLTMYANPSYCTVGVPRHQTGKGVSDDCNAGRGCAVQESSPTFFSKDFNDAGGGVVAADVRQEGVRVWRFERGRVPADMLGESPDPEGWGDPMAEFPGLACQMKGMFQDWAVVLDINLCGKPRAGQEIQADGCGDSSCVDFVTNNAEAFRTAFWELGSVRILYPHVNDTGQRKGGIFG